MNVAAKNNSTSFLPSLGGVGGGRITEPVRVVWNKRINGGMTAIAENDAAGYSRGDIIMVLEKELTILPNTVHIIPKYPHNAI